jgi:hypothetical protein
MIQALKFNRVNPRARDSSSFGSELRVECYTDSDFANDLETRKSVGGYVILVGSNPVSWQSKKQPMVALSSTEAEYVAAAESMKELIWIMSLMEELQVPIKKTPTLYVDNQSSIHLIKNPVIHSNTKHIDIRIHFMRNIIEEKNINIQYCQTQKNLADIFTKPLKKPLFIQHRNGLNLMDTEKAQVKGVLRE